MSYPKFLLYVLFGGGIFGAIFLVMGYGFWLLDQQSDISVAFGATILVFFVATLAFYLMRYLNTGKLTKTKGDNESN